MDDPASKLRDKVKIAAKLRAQGNFTVAAKEFCGVVEEILRECLLTLTPGLGDAERLRVQKAEQEMGKNVKGVRDFTFGEIIGVVRQSKFLAAVAGPKDTVQMVDLTRIATLRNDLIHHGHEVSDSECDLLEHLARSLLKLLTVEDEDDEEEEPEKDRPAWWMFAVFATAIVAFFVWNRSGRGAGETPNDPGTPPARTLREILQDSLGAGRPFVNSRGMTFIPVEKTRILLCVHETRVGDFRVFAAANASAAGSRWESPPFEQTEEHPVTTVTWKEASAFCQWLSREESLPYRLPTDHEWSCAVGLSREDALHAPAMHDRVLPDFPWGGDFPPAAEDGNYGELEDDGHKFTAPVGSYKADAHGFHDLGGNVREWCMDLYDPRGGTSRTLRGASWKNYGGRALRSSSRTMSAEDAAEAEFGFRCAIDLDLLARRQD